jgi:hypothetical protein
MSTYAGAVATSFSDHFRLVSLPGKVWMKRSRDMPTLLTQMSPIVRSSDRTCSTCSRRVSHSRSTIFAVKRMVISSSLDLVLGLQIRLRLVASFS